MNFNKKFFSFFVTILSILGYGVVVFATQLPNGTTPPSGGYLAGDSILDPGCAPGTTDCFQNTGSGWSLTGNAGTDGGTTNFIGTTDAQDFVIKTNGVQVAKFGTTTGVSLGNAAGGTLPSASGGGSVAIGSGTVASGTGSFAGGYNSTASGMLSHAFGFTANASATGSFALSRGVASDYYSFAFGGDTSATASGSSSAAWGSGTQASGDASTARGSYVTSRSFGESVFGHLNSDYTALNEGTTNNADRLFVIGNGVDSTTHNAYTLWQDGSFAYNDDNFQNDNPGTEQNMFYFNYGNHDGLGATQSKRAIRMGSSKNSEWNINSSDVGDRSLALGFMDVMYGGPTASGTRSIAIGNSNATNTGAVGIGSYANATGLASVAFQGGLASGDYSFSMYGNASGANSTAFQGQAQGNYSVSFGGLATGSNSTTFGSGTIAESLYETVFGSYPTDYTPANGLHDDWDTSDRLFTIGNGETDVSRSDAFTILKNGKTGIGYDNFETTNSNALLQINGGVLSSALTSCTLLQTDSNGLFSCGTLPTSPISVGASGNTLYSSGLSGTGQGDTSTGGNIILGTNAGTSASSASYVNFLGTEAGYAATWSSNANFLGYQAGYAANNAAGANFIGSGAGKNATNSGNANFIGTNAGFGASSSASANFIGFAAGQAATNAQYSNFVGQSAGYGATNAAISNFFGLNAGNGATNASNSIFIGQNTGSSDTVNNTGNTSDFSILIGGSNSTGGFSNSIAIGQSVTNTATNQFLIGSAIRPINTTRINGSSSTQCTITTGTGIACTSDERVKTNIADLASNTLENLLKVRTVTYNWLANPTSRQQVGFLAQDLEQFFPQLVDTDNEGMKSVYYAQMAPILVEGIRELHLKIEDVLSFTTSTDTTFLNTITTWLASETNGILNIFSKKLTSEQLCLKRTDGSERCLNAAEVDQILNNQNSSSQGGPQLPSPTPDPTPVPDPTPAPEPSPTPTPDPTPDPVPAPPAETPSDTPAL